MDEARAVAMTRKQRDALYGKSLAGHQLAEAYDAAIDIGFVIWMCSACGDSLPVAVGHASAMTCNGFNRHNQHAPAPMIKYYLVPCG